MQNTHHSFLVKLFIVIDIFVLTGCFVISYFFYDDIHPFFNLFVNVNIAYVYDPITEFVWMLVVTVLALISIFYIRGMYEPYKKITNFKIITDEALGFLCAFAVMTWLVFVFKLQIVNRPFVFLFLSLSGFVIFLEKTILLYVIGYARRKGLNHRQILVVGTGKRALNCIRSIDKNGASWGLEVFGVIDDDRVGETIENKKVFGGLDDIKDIIRKNVIDQVVYVIPRSWLGRIEKSVLSCEMLGIKVAIAVDFFDMLIARGHFTDIGGVPIIEFSTTSYNHFQLFVKRCIDLTVSLSLLILGAPLFVFIGMLIKATSRGPIIFYQRRMGLNGRKFDFFKFRSMVVDAERGRQKLEEKNEMNGPVFKMTNDPRITKIGKYLRKTSLDELPQLWNVFTGTMSLVGPRPPIPDEVDMYDAWHRRRLSVKPGLTCIWQISGRNENVDFDNWMNLDLEYIDNWSLWLDIKILVKTIPVLIICKGAK